MKRRRRRAEAIVDRIMAGEDTEHGSACEELGRLWKGYLKPHRKGVVFSVILSALVGVRAFAFALTTRFLVDDVLQVGMPVPKDGLHHRYGLLWIFIALVGAVWIVSLAAHWTRARISQSIGRKLVFALRKHLHEKLQELHIGFFERTPAGRIMSRVMDDVRIIQNWVANRFVQAATHAAGLIVGLCVLFYLDWQLALLVTVTLPCHWRLFLAVRPGIRRKNIASRRQNARLYGLAAERISGISVVKAFGREKSETRSFARHVADMLRVGMATMFSQQGLAFVSGIVSSVTAGLVTYIAVTRIQSGAMTLGATIAFINALSPLFMQINQLTVTVAAFEAFLVVLHRVFRLVDEPVETVPGKISLAGMEGGIEFKNVTFTHPGRHKPSLTDVSFEIAPGRHVALMGPSGAGKSTLFELLMRFYDPDSGQVIVGGVNLRNASTASVRQHVTMVQQEPTIFSGTIAENIAYGRLEASPAEIMRAAELAEFHDFVMSLPLKYETEVGEQGMTLSGGQKQRLALAMALLTDPEILLLDDTTSALDPVTESKIRETLNKALAGRTSLIITQRIATARHADYVIVLQNGAITQIGSHDKLSAEKGFYRHICRKQGLE